MDGLGPKWTVQKTKSGRSAKVDGPEIKKWTKGEKLDGLKERNWMVIMNECRRSKRFKVDGLKD